MARIIVVVSGKGGVGKTTITANLGVMLGLSGARVVLADADIGLNNLDVALGVEDRVVYDVIDIADGKANLKQALVEIPYAKNLKLIPSAKAYGSKRVGVDIYSGFIGEASLTSDYILIDAPAGIESGFHRAVCSAREAIIVTTPHINAIKDADRTARLLTTYNVGSTSLIVNRVRGDLIHKGLEIAPETIAELMRLPLVGAVPESDKVNVESLVSERRDSAFQAFCMLAKKISGKSEEVYDVMENFKGIRRFFRR